MLGVSRRRSVLFATLAFGLAATALYPEDSDPRLTVVRAGRVITISGKTLAPGVVIIEGDAIRAVGEKLEYDPSARVIDAPGATIMPGLVHARSRQGLSSYNRSGLKAGFSAAEEIVASELDIRPLVRNGFTTIGFAPSGGGLPGSVSVYSSSRPSSPPALLEERACLRVTMTSPRSDRSLLAAAIKKAREAIEKREKAREAWEKKRAEAEKQAKAKKDEGEKEKKEKPEPPKPGAPKPKDDEKKPDTPKKPAAPAKFVPPKIDRHLQTIVDILDGKPREKAPLLVEISGASDFRHLESVLSDVPEIKPNLSLETGRSSDLHYVIDAIAESKPLVVLRPRIHSYPYTINRYSVAAELARAGCDLAFIPSDSSSTLRGYRTEVAELVRAGLSRKTALAALTIAPARALGVDRRVGTIEKGKSADLIFLDGDPLDPLAEVTRVMVAGETIWTRGEDR